MPDIGLEELVGAGFSVEDAAAAEALVKKARTKDSWYSFKDGTNVLRYLPPLPGESGPYVVTYQHFLRGWGGGKKPFVFNCPREMGGNRCPACEVQDACYKNGSAPDLLKAKGLKAKLRVYARVVDRKDEESGVQIVGMPRTIFERLQDLRTSSDEYGEDFTHIWEGDDILIVRKKGDNGIVNYTTTVKHKSQQTLGKTDEQSREWLSNAPDLQRRGEVETYDELIARGEKLTEEARSAPVAGPAKPSADTGSFGSTTAESAIGDPAALNSDVPF